MYTLAFLLNTVLGILTPAIRQEKENKQAKTYTQERKGEKSICMTPHYMLLDLNLLLLIINYIKHTEKIQRMTQKTTYLLF